jgi:hypothetical protein
MEDYHKDLVEIFSRYELGSKSSGRPNDRLVKYAIFKFNVVM